MKHNKLPQWISSAVLGFILACAVCVNHAPAQGISHTNTIMLTDFDNSPSWTWGYGYDYFWGGTPTSANNWAYIPLYTNGLEVCYGFWFTNTPYQELVSTGGGFGIGFGGPCFNTAAWDVTTMSTNLFDYIFSFDARVEGLLADQTNGYSQMQFQWYPGNFLQCNFNITDHSNWTHYSFLLSDADGYEKGTISNWVFYIQNAFVTGAQWNMNQNTPNVEYGFDSDNAIFVDNIQLDMIVRTGAPPVVPPTVARTVLDWNMDDKPMWGGWGPFNWSANSFFPTFTWSPAAAGYGVGGSNAWILAMDNTALAPPNTPAWAGGTSGDNGPTDYSQFTSGDLKAYQLTFDARAQGLNPARLDPTICALQLFLDAPGGNYRLDFQIPAGTDWITTSYNLGQGSFNTEQGRLPKAAFATNYNATAVRIQCQIENANSEADWGFDADNVLVVDNIKLERIYVGCPPLTITTIGSDEVVTWAQPNTGSALLQRADSPAGPWNPVTGATSPHTNSVGAAPAYYRTLWVPPP